MSLRNVVYGNFHQNFWSGVKNMLSSRTFFQIRPIARGVNPHLHITCVRKPIPGTIFRALQEGFWLALQWMSHSFPATVNGPPRAPILYYITAPARPSPALSVTVPPAAPVYYKAAHIRVTPALPVILLPAAPIGYSAVLDDDERMFFSVCEWITGNLSRNVRFESQASRDLVIRQFHIKLTRVAERTCWADTFPFMSLVVLSFAPTRHWRTKRTMPELICDYSQTDMLNNIRWLSLTFAVLIEFLLGVGANGQIIWPNIWKNSGELNPFQPLCLSWSK